MWRVTLREGHRVHSGYSEVLGIRKYKHIYMLVHIQMLASSDFFNFLRKQKQVIDYRGKIGKISWKEGEEQNSCQEEKNEKVLGKPSGMAQQDCSSP